MSMILKHFLFWLHVIRISPEWTLNFFLSAIFPAFDRHIKLSEPFQELFNVIEKWHYMSLQGLDTKA